MDNKGSLKGFLFSIKSSVTNCKQGSSVIQTPVISFEFEHVYNAAAPPKECPKIEIYLKLTSIFSLNTLSSNLS